MTTFDEGTFDREVLPAYADAFKYMDADDVPVYRLWDVIRIAGKRHAVDFSDYLGARQDFDNWCGSKGYGAVDAKGVARHDSLVWAAEHKRDVRARQWKKVEHHSFEKLLKNKFFANSHWSSRDASSAEAAWEDELDTQALRELALRYDRMYYNKAGWRTKLADVLALELGVGVRVASV